MAILITTRAVTDHGMTRFTQEALQQMADAAVGQTVWYPDDPQGARVGVVEHASASVDGTGITLTIRVEDDAVIFLDRAPSEWRLTNNNWR
ncbi:MAG: hypothetical protein ACXWP0_01210 [Ktedonobacterales bacterium]